MFAGTVLFVYRDAVNRIFVQEHGFVHLVQPLKQMQCPSEILGIIGVAVIVISQLPWNILIKPRNSPFDPVETLVLIVGGVNF
jgi:hypothetical protein